MVRLKIAYWEFDFEAVCPTLDHDLLSQAHIYIQWYSAIIVRSNGMYNATYGIIYMVEISQANRAGLDKVVNGKKLE